jgi:hypothetical protein
MIGGTIGGAPLPSGSVESHVYQQAGSLVLDDVMFLVNPTTGSPNANVRLGPAVDHFHMSGTRFAGNSGNAVFIPAAFSGRAYLIGNDAPDMYVVIPSSPSIEQMANSWN